LKDTAKTGTTLLFCLLNVRQGYSPMTRDRTWYNDELVKHWNSAFQQTPNTALVCLGCPGHDGVTCKKIAKPGVFFVRQRRSRGSNCAGAMLIFSVSFQF